MLAINLSEFKPVFSSMLEDIFIYLKNLLDCIKSIYPLEDYYYEINILSFSANVKNIPIHSLERNIYFLTTYYSEKTLFAEIKKEIKASKLTLEKLLSKPEFTLIPSYEIREFLFKVDVSAISEEHSKYPIERVSLRVIFEIEPVF